MTATSKTPGLTTHAAPRTPDECRPCPVQDGCLAWYRCEVCGAAVPLGQDCFSVNHPLPSSVQTDRRKEGGKESQETVSETTAKTEGEG